MSRPDSKQEFIAKFARLAEEMWDAAEVEARALLIKELMGGNAKPPGRPRGALSAAEPESPQKRGAQGRAQHGSIKSAVRDAIYSRPDGGISRPEIVRYARDNLGVTIKAGSLKQAIRILKQEKAIRNQDGKWFPAQTTAQGKPGAGAPDLLNRQN